LPFGVSPLVNGYNAELLLLLPEYRGEKMPGIKRISWLGCCSDATAYFGDGVGDILLSKKNARGSNERLLPLDP
jgi:hypothetical protein